MTVLPSAHEFEPRETGRRCASCGFSRKFGVHRVERLRSVGMRARRTARYRTSGTPFMARPAVLVALPIGVAR